MLFKAYLLQNELKLGSVQQQLEENLGAVLGVVDDLLFYLTKPFVIWIID